MQHSRMQPHHDGSAPYVSTQQPALGDVVLIRLRVPASYGPVDRVSVRSNPNREPRFSPAALMHSADGWDWFQAEVEVENPVHGYRFLIVGADGSRRWLNATGLHEIESLDAEDFKLVAHEPAPDW